MAGRMLAGCGLGVWLLAALNLATWDSGRSLTRSQSEVRERTRAEYWACVKKTAPEKRPSCHSRESILMAGTLDLYSIARNLFLTPLLALLGVIVLLGATAGLFLCVGVARGNIPVIRVAVWATGCAAASSAALLAIGVLPESTTAAALAQSFCFAVLVSLRLEKPDQTHFERIRRPVRNARPELSHLPA